MKDFSLLEQLIKYSQKDVIPMHMPGHKRNSSLDLSLPYKIDITEIHDFDDLHNASGILEKCMERTAKLWKSEKTFFLVGGSTVGILAGIRSVCVNNKDNLVIVARNCHKAVYHALEICNADVEYILPQWEDELGINGSIYPKDVEDTLQKFPNAKLLVITSPTYEGVISDISTITNIAHRYGIPVMVDEAHGAHLDLEDGFKYGAIQAGADIVIQSIHKTLYGLTQTALCHVQGELINHKDISRQLDVFETSSPSYPLMASIDNCVRIIEKGGKELFEKWLENINEFNNGTKELIKLKNIYNEFKNNKALYKSIWRIDSSKIVISTMYTKLTGIKLADILRNEYNIEVEMSSHNYIVCMTGIGDSKKNYQRLLNALKSIDKRISNNDINNDLKNNNKINSIYQNVYTRLPEKKMKILDALTDGLMEIESEKAIGKICGEYIWIYPPGIPLICPGEVLDKRMFDYLNMAVKKKLNVIKTGADFPNILCCSNYKTNC